MIELKFRAWDIHKKVMYENYQWMDTNDPHMGGGVHRDYSYVIGRKTIKGRGASAHHIVMQYTGIEDKNGKELYGGHIAKHYKLSDLHNRYPIVGEVIIEVSRGVVIGGWPAERNIEIVGNQYENPELLE